MITTLKEEQNNSSTYGNSVSARSKLDDLNAANVPKDQKIRMKHGPETYLKVPQDISDRNTRKVPLYSNA